MAETSSLPARGLLDLPTEILQNILTIASTPSFVQLSVTSKKLYDIAANSRDVLLHHLHSIPGIKLGLDDATVANADLFLLFRQRASKALYGCNFTADCIEFRARHAPLDACASCMSELYPDHLFMSLVLKHTATVRLYGPCGSLKEHIFSPFCGGKVDILQVVHHKGAVSILYQWQADLEPEKLPNLPRALVKCNPLKKPQLESTPSPVSSDTEDNEDETSDEVQDENAELAPRKRYYLRHHDLLARDNPVTFAIPQHNDLIPRHMAISSRLVCAILWDEASTSQATTSAEIVLYTAQKIPISEEGTYDSRVVWPTNYDLRPLTPTNEEIAKGKVAPRPRKISFFKDGRRLRLYGPGDVVPFRVVGTSSYRESQSPTNSVFFQNLTSFRIDTPFFGCHETYWDSVDEGQFCNVSHLCLGVTEIQSPSFKCKILCVLRSRSKLDHEDCCHAVDLSRMNHVSADNCKAVARLWGWTETSSNLTGLETVAVSSYGTRIAIAQWNRVLVWSLDPKMLCEEIVDPDSEDERKRSKKKKKKAPPHAKGVADDFYARKKDELLGWKIADLKPIVLNLNGAVVRSMGWVHKPGLESEEDDSDLDPLAETSGQVAIADDPRTTTVVDSDYSPHTPKTTTVSATVHKSAASPIAGEDAYSMPTADAGVKMHTTEIEIDKPDVLTQTTIATTKVVGRSDLPEILAVRSPSDRSSLLESCQRGRMLHVESKSPMNTLALDTEYHIQGPAAPSQCETPTNILVTDPQAGPPTVIEATSLPSERGTAKLKGKQKETDVSVQWARSGHSEPEPEPPLVAGKGKKATESHPHRRKRFTEDELIIMTDRGFQVWNLSVWGTALRQKKWLSEE